MRNIRLVITNPPKMFMDAKRTAIHPITFAVLISGNPADNNAPTMMTEDIAFVTAIKGECRAGVTCQTT